MPRADYVLPVVAGVAAALLFFFLQKDLGPALFLSCVFLITYAIARNRVGLAVTGFATARRRLLPRLRAEHLLDAGGARGRCGSRSWDNGARGGEQIAQAIWASRRVDSLAPGLAWAIRAMCPPATPT